MSETNDLWDVLRDLKAGVKAEGVQFDWGKYQGLADEFLQEAKTLSKVAAEKIVEHQQKMMAVVTRVQRGELPPVVATRTTARYQRAIQSTIEKLGEQLQWEAARRWWTATDDLIQFIGLVASAVIKHL